MQQYERPPVADIRSVLDFDPDLGARIGDDEWPAARRAFRGTLLAVEPGVWVPPADEDALGVLIAGGVVCREVSLVDRRSLELLGSGDIVHRPAASEWPQLGDGTKLTAVTDTIAIVLGPAFVRAAARWPSVLVAAHRRIDAQRERLAIQGLIVHVPRAEQRLLLAMWHLASRWGRVTPAGTVIPLHLTHDLIGQMIAARRSTATLAVHRAESEGWLARRPDGTWLLSREAGERAARLAHTQAARSDGATLMIRQRRHELPTEHHRPRLITPAQA